MEKCLRWIIAILCLSVTATVCASCGGAQAEKTELDAPVIASAVYTGETIRATVPENDGYEIVANEGGIYAGEYDVVLKLSDESKYAWKNPDEGDANKVTLKFAITQADNEITDFAVADVVFGEASVLPVATAKFGTPTFTYSDSANGTFTEAVPSAVGKYFAKATVAEIADYKGADKVVSFRITKKAPVFTAEATAVIGLMYDGFAHALVTAAATADGTVEYKLGEDGEWGESIPAAINAGTYKVFYRIKGDESHADYEVTEPVTITIAKANAEFTAPTAKTDLVYTGSAIELVVAGSATGGEMQYKLGEDEYDTTVPAAINAGTYTVYYKVIGDGNHNDAAEVSITVTIAKAKNVIEFNKDSAGNVTSVDFTYGEDPIQNATATSGEVTYTYISAHWEGDEENKKPVADDGNFAPWNKTNKAGLYLCRMTAGNDNYETVEKDRWVTVYARETDENGVKYEFDETTQTYGVSGYAGSATEVNVPGTFSDGANGEKSVTYVKSDAFKDTNVIKKIVFPMSVTTLKGLAFFNCSSVEYISMAGVTEIGDGGNNLTHCYSLKTLIVHEGLKVTGQLLQSGDDTKNGVTSVYVDGTSKISYNADLNKLIKTVYYKGDGEKCFTWTTNADGTIKAGPAAHNYGSDGKCTVCGEYDTKGVTYAYADGSYYVTGYTGSDNEVTVLGKYNDGVNGEHDVTYVANGAFREKAIKKVILPESVTDLGGSVFLNSKNLAYVDMRGVKSLIQTNCAAGPDGSKERNNNFLGCGSLGNPIKIIVAPKFLSDVGQFHASYANLYVYGATGAPSTTDIANVDGRIYYMGDVTKCGYWNFDSNGNIVKNDGSHNFASGVCENCGRIEDHGVEYVFGKTGEYYAAAYTGSETTVNVLGKYNDGVNGEHDVTYVASHAFKEKAIKKVILPESVTDLGGGAFMKCTSLEYIDMRGVKSLIYKIPGGRPDGTNGSNNNFLGCTALKTVVVGSGFNSDVGQFHSTNKPNLYVYGAEGAGEAPSTGDAEGMIGNIYYYSEVGASGYWNYVDGVATLH